MKRFVCLGLLSLFMAQIPAMAVSLVINEEDKYKPIRNDGGVKSVTINCNGGTLDLTSFSEHIIVNGNGNRIVAHPCDSLTLTGSGNSIDFVDGTRITKIRQGTSGESHAVPLIFYELDSTSPNGVKFKNGFVLPANAQ